MKAKFKLNERVWKKYEVYKEKKLTGIYLHET